MNRPEKELKPEIAEIKALVEANYRAEIERLNAEIINDQAAKMLETAKRKRAEEQAKAEQEELEQYVKEVTEALKVSADAGVAA
ncbi:hypothetical protein D3C84_1110090 [compost metagenome]